MNTVDNKIKMKTKVTAGLIIVSLAILALVMAGGFTSNQMETWTIIQRPFQIGSIEKIGTVDDRQVFIPKVFGSEATYKDTYTVFFSSKADEGGSKDDSVGVRFIDKGTAKFSAQVVFSTPFGDKEAQKNFHKLARGNEKVVIQTVKTSLNEASRFTATKLTASEFFEGQEEATESIRTRMKNDELLTKWGIIIDSVKLSEIDPDDLTDGQFKQQQTAILEAKKAEANKVKYAMQELETQANYSMQIEKVKGEAEMVAMKARTDAQREKEMAEIAAEKKVNLAEYARQEAEVQKQQAEIEANRQLEIAKIAKLEAIELADAKIIQAKAREQEIALSGAMTETAKITLQIQADRDVRVAEQLSKIAVPKVVIGGGAGGEGGSGNTQFDNLLSLKIAKDFGITLID